MSTIRIKIGNTIFDGWQYASLTRSITELCHSFEFRGPDGHMADGKDPSIKPGDICKILVDDFVVSTGYVDGVRLEYDSGARSFSVFGRSKTCDLVDCAADIKSFRLSGKTFGEIAKTLCAQVGVDVVIKKNSSRISELVIDQGEKIFDVLSRISRMYGILIRTDGDGRLVLQGTIDASKASYSISGISEGVISASRELNHSERFSSYICKSQAGGVGIGDTAVGQGGKESALDSDTRQSRKTIIIAEESATRDQLKSRADWERNVRKGRSDQISYFVQGLLAPNKKPWSPGDGVHVKDDFLRLDGVLVIESVVMTADFEQGTRTAITFASPGSLDLEPVKNKKKKKTAFTPDAF